MKPCPRASIDELIESTASEHTYTMFLCPRLYQMLRGREHAVFIVDGDRCVEAFLRWRVDADDRHMNTLQLLDFLRFNAERRYEHGVDVASHRKIRKEVTPVLTGIDMLEQRDVVSGIMHDGIDSSEYFHIEPAGDFLIHQHGDTVRLP